VRVLAAAREVQAAWSASTAAGRRWLTTVKEIPESLFETLSAHLGGTESSAATQEQLDHISTAWAAARLVPA
jgi:hypothetical protein